MARAVEEGGEVWTERAKRVVMIGVLVLAALQPASPVVANEEPTSLQPDLAMAPPADFSVQHKAGGGRWLRFSTIVVNIGDGPFDVYGYEPGGTTVEETSVLAVRQRIRDSAGNWLVNDVPASMSYSGDGHDHWHVQGLQQYDLAFEATRADTIRNGNKTGFCFYDTDHYSGDEPRHYYPGTVNVCHVEKNSEGVEWVRMGLTVGWGDKYPASISGQYIDITGLPYGTYWLTVTADPSGEFIEKSTGNNGHRSKIRIERSGVTVLYQDPAPGTDSLPPDPPADLTATPGNESVLLGWADNAEPDVSHYRVYRQDGEQYLRLDDTSVTAYTDTGLENGTLYCYHVTAVDSAGNESAPSDGACAEPSEISTAISVHIADLDGSSSSDGRHWTATVVAQVHDSSHSAVPGAMVSGSWSGGDGLTSECVTDGDGRCILHTTSIPKSTGNVSFGVTAVSSADATYVRDDNHDPDGDSNGTSIDISKP